MQPKAVYSLSLDERQCFGFTKARRLCGLPQHSKTICAAIIHAAAVGKPGAELKIVGSNARNGSSSALAEQEDRAKIFIIS